jgi:hypothetical protein
MSEKVAPQRHRLELSVTGDGLAGRVLRDYVHRIAAGLGVGPESTWCEVDSPASAYVALERTPRWHKKDLALVWDEQHGWAVAVETHSGEDLLILAYFGPEQLPEPEDVVRFAAKVLAGEPAGQTEPPRCRTGDLRTRLESIDSAPSGWALA